MYDADKRREMYGIENILGLSVNQVISLVEKKEMARDAHSAVGISAGVSSFKKHKKKQCNTEEALATQGTCPGCKKKFSLFRDGRFGRNTKPFDMCRNCYLDQRRHQNENSGHNKRGASSNNAISHADDDAQVGVIASQISGISEYSVNDETKNLRNLFPLV